MGTGKIKREDADAIVDKLHRRWKAKRTHVYDAYALIVSSSVCIDRHHVIFVRRDDGCFMCFDDDRIEEIGSLSDVRSEIAERGNDASIRLLVYRRKSPETSRSLPSEASRD